jgi:hypothetical protein
MTSAQKAVKTKAARKAFRDQYGDESYEVVSRIVRGEKTGEIYDYAPHYVPWDSISSYRANVTRGTYDHVLADCNF